MSTTPTVNRRIRVFISSTFSDFAASYAKAS
jgi:hypothetical protein